jgi:hypothetical protein
LVRGNGVVGANGRLVGVDWPRTDGGGFGGEGAGVPGAIPGWSGSGDTGNAGAAFAGTDFGIAGNPRIISGGNGIGTAGVAGVGNGWIGFGGTGLVRGGWLGADGIGATCGTTVGPPEPSVWAEAVKSTSRLIELTNTKVHMVLCFIFVAVWFGLVAVLYVRHPALASTLRAGLIDCHGV